MIAALGLFVFPFATLSRGFGGEGTLLTHPGGIVSFASFKPEKYPDFAGANVAGWLTLAGVLALGGLAWARSRFVGWAGALLMLLVCVQLGLVIRAIDLLQFPLLEGGTPYRRLAFQGFGPNIGALLIFLAGAYGVVVGLSQQSAWAKRFSSLRGAIVPAVSLLLAMVLGGIVILFLQPTPGAENGPQGVFAGWLGKVDLLWYSYSSLFGPALPKFRPAFDLAGPLQSLTQATPLIFTGLALAFGFRASLFNIGAPGQIVFGAIFAAAVGIYVPGPWIFVAPLAIVAAALGGAFWGAIPGFLKARFGSSEVINTIMLNAIGSSILVFLIGSNKASFFGREVPLPFKAPGGEAKSLELGAGSHLEPIGRLLNLQSGDNAINFTVPLVLLGLLVGFLVWRGSWRARVIPALALGAVGLVLGLLIGTVTVPISSAMASARLNLSFLLALLAAAFFGVFMWRTRWGFEIRALGLSPKAAEYGGVNIARTTMLAMAISGALAGLAATHYVMGGALEEYRLKQSMPADTAGFGGITVALLGYNTPVGVIASSILFGVMNTGGLNLDQALDKISREIVTVLQALIVLFIAARGFLSGNFFRAINAPVDELDKNPQQVLENKTTETTASEPTS